MRVPDWLWGWRATLRLLLFDRATLRAMRVAELGDCGEVPDPSHGLYRRLGRVLMLPCFVCGSDVKPALPDLDSECPLGAVQFRGVPSYGSEFDGDGPLELAVCDGCLRGGASRVAFVETVTRVVDTRLPVSLSADADCSRPGGPRHLVRVPVRGQAGPHGAVG